MRERLHFLVSSFNSDEQLVVIKILAVYVHYTFMRKRVSIDKLEIPMEGLGELAGYRRPDFSVQMAFSPSASQTYCFYVGLVSKEMKSV